MRGALTVEELNLVIERFLGEYQWLLTPNAGGYAV